MAPILVLVFHPVAGLGCPAGLGRPDLLDHAGDRAFDQLHGLDARITRSSMLEGSQLEPHPHGARQGPVGTRGDPAHALKPAMLPVISYLGPAFVTMITGSVVVDMYFSTGGSGAASSIRR